MASGFVLAIDLAGSFAFALSGATVGVRHRLDVFGVLVAQIPAVLRRELYAVAAALGAGVVVVGEMLGLPPAPLAMAGASACFVLRYLAIRRGWGLPVASIDSSG